MFHRPGRRYLTPSVMLAAATFRCQSVNSACSSAVVGTRANSSMLLYTSCGVALE